MELKLIITGATGMVGEGVLLVCLEHPDVKEVLILNRKHYPLKHPKLKECLVADFMQLESVREQLTGYDACLFCAGISSVGMKEADYRHITYNITLHVAETLSALNRDMSFIYVSGEMTDSTEQGKIMWARVKGKTENDLLKLPFKQVFNFRPGLMKPVEGQLNIKGFYKLIYILYPILNVLFPSHSCPLRTVALAMIHCVEKGYPKPILEIKDIKIQGTI